MTRFRKLIFSVLLTVALSVPVFAQASVGNAAKDAGVGVAQAVCNIVYGPAKVIYATLGTIITPLVWGLTGGDREATRKWVYSSVLGDYGLTRGNLEGRDTFDFVGRVPPAPGTEATASLREEGF